MTWDGVLYALLGAAVLLMVWQCVKQAKRDALECARWRREMRSLDDWNHHLYVDPAKRYERPDSREQRIEERLGGHNEHRFNHSKSRGRGAAIHARCSRHNWLHSAYQLVKDAHKFHSPCWSLIMGQFLVPTTRTFCSSRGLKSSARSLGLSPTTNMKFRLKTGAKTAAKLYSTTVSSVILKRGEYVCGEGMGSATSRESKYRWRWIDSFTAKLTGLDVATTLKKGGSVIEPAFAIEKAQTAGKYGKPVEYWQQFKDAIKAGTARKTVQQTKDGRPMDAWEIDATLYQYPKC